MLLSRLIVLMLCLVVLGVNRGDAASQPDLISPSIVLNLPSRTLELFSGSALIKVYPIAIGKPSTPSPLGNFSIINKEYDPSWYPPRGGYVVPSGPDNPLGYRWMGFLPLYGIHGTNAPWAIGEAVSNGCIRMKEEDVEEIFEVVPYGTPVHITYERTKVRINDQQLSLGIYPDVYGYGDVSVWEVRQKLNNYGLGWVVPDEMIIHLIREETDRQVVLAQFYKLKVNDKVLVERVIAQQDAVHIPVWAVAKQLNVNIVRDELTQTIKSGNFTVPGVEKGNILCVSPENLQLLFGGKVVVTNEDKTVAVNFYHVAFNGRTLRGDARMVGEVLAVPALALVDAMGQKPVWDGKAQTLFAQGTTIPVSMIGDQPYIPITKIYEYFKAYVYWNQEGYSVELTYPFSPTKGND